MDEQATKRLRGLRIIIAAMLGGMLAFGGVAVAIVRAGSIPQNEGLGSTLLLILGLLPLGEMPAYVVLRQATIARLRRSCAESSSDVERTTSLLNGFATLTIIAGAMVEGLALFGIVIYMVSGKTLALLAPGVAIILLATIFPSVEKARQFESSAIPSGI